MARKDTQSRLGENKPNAETREKAEKHDGAGVAFARGSVAAYERRPGRRLKTSSSLLSIDECFIPAAARPAFRSPRSPPRC
eukprot:1470123-Pleurochrysis_carterae.AAC.1